MNDNIPHQIEIKDSLIENQRKLIAALKESAETKDFLIEEMDRLISELRRGIKARDVLIECLRQAAS